MPEIIRLAKCRICLYPGDHVPPHFHVHGPGWAVLIEIASLRVLQGNGPRPALEEAIRWARVPDNAYRLSEKWRHLNERD